MASNKNDNVVDLTAGDSSGAKKKTAKAKQPVPAPPTPEPEPKKKKGRKGLVIFILILILLIGGFIFEEIQFNLLGLRDLAITTAIDTVTKLEPEYQSYQERYQKLDTVSRDLDKREEELNKRQEQLDAFQKDLEDREEVIKQREIRLTPVYRQPLSGQDLADMESLSTTYSQMDAETAAQILASLYDNQDIAAILYYMSERSAAAVLAAMDVDLAAALTEILLYK